MEQRYFSCSSGSLSRHARDAYPRRREAANGREPDETQTGREGELITSGGTKRIGGRDAATWEPALDWRELVESRAA